VHHADAPDEDAHLERLAGLDAVAQELAERARIVLRTKLDGRVEVPADDEDRAPGREEGRPEMLEIGSGVDEDRCPVRRFDAPAVPAFCKNAQ
jgi:hypothetical protein